MNCQWTETAWGIWIDTNANNSNKERLCMIDKREKKIIWQVENEDVTFDFKILNILYKIVEELGWNDEN